VAQMARTVGVSLWPPEMWKYCLMRNQVTLREGELRFYLTPVVPDELTLKILGPEE
jgi:hypothetical protein